MREIVGTKKGDWIFTSTYDAVLVYGRGGPDDISGSVLADTIYGGPGNDLLSGAGGNDTIFGGNGNDTIYGDYYYADGDTPAGLPSLELIRGGNGDDTIYGGPGGGWIVAVGGAGDDAIYANGGQLFGDEAPGEPQVAAGNDLLVTGMGLGAWAPTDHTGGRGADVFYVNANTFDGIASRVDVRDFTAEDRVAFHGASPDGLQWLYGPEMFAALDTNGDRVLDGTDAPSAVGVTWADPFANALCMQLFDGDMVAVWGTQALSDWQMV